jgi:hypothetical protein
MTIIKAAAVQLSPDHEVEVSAIPITVAVLFHSGFGHTARQAPKPCGVESNGSRAHLPSI